MIVIRLLLIISSVSWSQDLDFPVGIGGVGLGHRHYVSPTHGYDQDGKVYPLNSILNRELDGESLLDGAGGEPMQKLAQELLKWGGGERRQGDLLDDLELGRLDAQIRSRVDVSMLTIVMGIFENYTAYVLFPFINASVDIGIEVVGENKAANILPRLSGYAYDELSEGIERASRLSGQDIVSGIMDLGYKDPRHWSYKGIGDIVLGGYYNRRFSLWDRNHISALHTSLSLPTGPYDDPNHLSDISISYGYYRLGNQISTKFTILDSFYFAGFVGVGLGPPTSVEKRLPEGDEEFVSRERLTRVELHPGMDYNYGIEPSYRLGWFTFLYELGAKHHTKDRYSGKLSGNYAKLEDKTDTFLLYQTPKVRLETVEPFLRNQASLPIVAQLSAQYPLAGRNTMIQPYYELGIAVVFSTPFYKSDEKSATRLQPRKTRNPGSNSRVKY